MSPPAVFLIVLAAIFAAAVVFYTLASKAWRSKAAIHDFREPDTGELDETAMGMLDGLTEWLQNERIVKAMIDTHTASRDELQTTLLALPVLNAGQIRSTCKALLRNRNVRRVIAIEFMKEKGFPREMHAQALQGLAEYAQIEPVRTGIKAVDDMADGIREAVKRVATH